MTIAGRTRGPVQLALIFTTLLGCASSPHATRADLRRIEPTLAPLPSQDRHEAEEAPSFDGSLAGYLGYAFAHSPALRAQFETWRAMSHRPAQERKLPEPTITYAGFVRSVETRVGPQRHRLGASQWFPWPTTLKAGGEAAHREAEAAMRRFEALALQLGADVSAAYWRLWTLQRQQEVLAEQVEVLGSLSEQVRVRVEVGAAELADLARIDLLLSRTRDQHAGLHETIRIAKARLVRVLGAPPQTSVPTLADEPRLAALAEDDVTLTAEVTDHPEVTSFVAMSEAAEQRQRQARARRAPSFGLGVDWILTGPARQDPAPRGSGQDAVALSLSMKVPLWGGAYAAGENEARARGAAARARALDARNGLMAQVREHTARIRDAVRRVQVYDTTLIPQAQTAFESVVASYAAGRSSVSDLLLAERDLLALRSERYAAQADYATDLARLESVVGRPISLEEHDTPPGVSNDR